MKKIFMLVLCLILSGAFLTGCSDGGETFEEKTYTPDERIGGIELDVHDRDIEVSLSEDGQIHVRYFESGEEGYEIGVSDDNILTVTSADSKSWSDYIGKKPSDEYRKIYLQIPDALLDSAVLSSTNGNISLPELTVNESVNVSCSGGNIYFDTLNVGESIDLNVKNGDISGTIAGGYDDFAISSEIKKGECNLPETKNGGEKTLNVSGNNGDINIEFVKK